MGAISSLQQQVQSLLAELNAVREEILKYKLIGEANMIMPSSSHVLLPSSEAVSIAAPPPPTLPPLHPLPTTSSIYTQQATDSTNYSTSSSDHFSYFG